MFMRWLLVAVFALSVATTVIADAPGDCREQFDKESDEYLDSITVLEENLTDWCTRELPANEAREAVTAFVDSRIVVKALPERFRNTLRASQKKYLASLRTIQRNAKDEKLQNDVQESREKLLNEMKVSPKPGWYAVVLQLHKNEAARRYRITANAGGGFDIQAAGDPATKLLSSDGTVSWDDEKCGWGGNLQSKFAHDPQQKPRTGKIFLRPIDELHLEGEQTIHKWDEAGGDKRKLLGKAEWKWYSP
jgi:hypothetical protein